uniref:Uncharacterized protein n=1 Tax=Clytia hemisphaerica TaxID=252671 RepID=A0A7M5V643_9CNID
LLVAVQLQFIFKAILKLVNNPKSYPSRRHRDFNMDGFEMEHDQLLADILQDYDLVPNFPTHIDGKMLDQIWTHKELVHEYGIEVIRKCVNLSDHDGVKLSLTLLA